MQFKLFRSIGRLFVAENNLKLDLTLKDLLRISFDFELVEKKCQFYI
jgi:hypothetical protein